MESAPVPVPHVPARASVLESGTPATAVAMVSAGTADAPVAIQLKAELLNRIRSHTAHVGVVGLGYVGLPFAVEKAKVGFPVTGIDLGSLRAVTPR